MSTTGQPSPRRPDSVVAVCTRNRPDDLSHALAATQSSAPGVLMLVADASDPAQQELVRSAAAAYPTCTFLACEPGLARQRNQALDWVRDHLIDVRIVHFIDDDTEPLDGYFDAIEHAFEQDPDLGGVGGVILNQPETRFRRLKSLFSLSSPRHGVVLPSGRTTVGHYPGHEALHAQLLPGCAMSYRLTAIDGLEFDNRLEGVSINEDLYFSFALSRTHRLMVAKDARAYHHTSPVNRSTPAGISGEAVALQHRFVRENTAHGLRLSAFWWSVVGEIILRLVFGVASRDRSSILQARAIAAAAWNTMRNPMPARPSR